MEIEIFPGGNEDVFFDQDFGETNRINGNQCRILGYSKVGISVWDPKLRPQNSQQCKN